MTTAREIANKYVCKILRDQYLELFTKDIIQFATKVLLENRRIIEAKKMPADIVEYLPIEIDTTWPTSNSDAPFEIALRYFDHTLGCHAVDDAEKEIKQYAISAVVRDRANIKTNNVLPRLIMYLPLPVLV